MLDRAKELLDTEKKKLTNHTKSVKKLPLKKKQHK